MNAATARAPRPPIRWSLVLATFAVLAAIVWLRKSEPSFADKLAPFVLEGRTGERIQARNFAVRVKRLKLARAYLTEGSQSDAKPRRVAADGLWLSVLAEVEPLREPGYVSARLVARDGREYLSAPNDRPKVRGTNFGQLKLATGLTGTGAYFFDVPENALQGARIAFHWGLSSPGDLDHVIEIDPGLDAAAVRELRDGAVPLLDLVP